MCNFHYRECSVLLSALLCLSLILGGFSSYASAQEPGPSAGTLRGIELYQQGDAPGAIKTTEAIKAARQIKFQPAIKDDKPASTYIQLEYNFNLY
jgi:hypothetical protein